MTPHCEFYVHSKGCSVISFWAQPLRMTWGSDIQWHASWRWPSWLYSSKVYHQHKPQHECNYLCLSFLVWNVVSMYTQLLLLFYFNWKCQPIRGEHVFTAERFLYNIAVVPPTVGRWQPETISCLITDNETRGIHVCQCHASLCTKDELNHTTFSLDLIHWTILGLW